MSVGIGLSINNTARVLRPFQQEIRVRPDAEVPHRAGADEWVGKKYRQTVSVQPLIELLLGLYFTWTVFYALANGIYGTLPFLVLFQVGFLYTACCRSSSSTRDDDSVVLNTQVAAEVM
jgi:hypothetical protein